MPSIDLGLIKLEGDGIDRVKILHRHVDLEGACPAAAAWSPIFAFDDMKDMSDFDHLIVGAEVSGQEVEWNCGEPMPVSISLGNIILKEDARFSRTKRQVIKPQSEVNLFQLCVTPLGD